MTRLSLHAYAVPVFALLIACSLLFAQNGQIVPQTAVVKQADGTAEYKAAERGAWQNAVKGSVLKMKSAILTGKRSTVELQFESGVTCVIGQNSYVELAKLLKNQTNNSMRTRLVLDSGQLWIEMPSYKEQTGWFDIETQSALVYVRNSVAKVIVDSNHTFIDVYRGTAKLRHKKSAKEAIVKPHQRGVVVAGREEVQVAELVSRDEQTPAPRFVQSAGASAGDELSIAMLSVQSTFAEKKDLNSIANYIALEIDKNSSIEVMFLDDVEDMLRAEG
ncbi:MAG: hypothetical protein GF398_18745, partial [Chitinivibrionales bacterium]|nr:hypothetical protein [Chitinivibrionales bacterium]